MITESGHELMEKEAVLGAAARALGTTARALGSSKTLAPAMSKLKKGWSAVKGSNLGSYAKNKVQDSGAWKAGVKDFNTPAFNKKYKALSRKYRAAKSGPRTGASAQTASRMPKTAATQEESPSLKVRRALGLTGSSDANTRLMGIGGALSGAGLTVDGVRKGVSLKRSLATRGIPTLAGALALGAGYDKMLANARRNALEERRDQKINQR